MARKKREVLRRGSDHYKQGEVQPIEYMFGNGVGVAFCIGCVIKYITRFKFSEDPIKDLEKTKHYIDFIIDHLKHGGDVEG